MRKLFIYPPKKTRQLKSQRRLIITAPKAVGAPTRRDEEIDMKISEAPSARRRNKGSCELVNIASAACGPLVKRSKGANKKKSDRELELAQ